MSNFPIYASVVLDAALDKLLDYGIPSELQEMAKRGKRVEVPVRGHPRKGTIFELKEKPSFAKVQPIKRYLSEDALISDDLFELAVWMSTYYCSPLSHVLKVMLPSSLRKQVRPKEQLFVMRSKTKEILKKTCIEIRNKAPGQAEVLDVMLQVKKGILLSELLEKTKGSRSPVDTLVKKGLITLDAVRVDRSPLVGAEYFRSKPKKLNKEQQEAFDKIVKAIDQTLFETHLLHGITGSGKTEIYLQALQRCLTLGKSAIVLVPEISLTAQTIARFRSRFDEKIAILHHRLSDGERSDEWQSIKSGKAKIIIGARSAIFSPAKNLGLIIVDEEHESSYKQTEEIPCYNARDIAVMRGHTCRATVILGSATPSIESTYNVKQGKYILSTLRTRPEATGQAQVTIVDMKKEFEKAKGYTNFSGILLDKIKSRHEKGEQTILFLNRRGYHTTLFCKECREAVKCRHCDISLTLHRKNNMLSCHLCGFSLPPPKACPKCQNPDPIQYKGVGTELLENSLLAIFPEIRTLRIDADTTRHKGSHQRLLKDFGTGKADVLIGTQMIAKGLHFPEVTLVGVINCDMALHIPDYRSSETVFQLITQVAGRAGRGSTQGEVILQTCMPDNTTIGHAANQDYESFYKEEIVSRESFDFPPFSKIVKLTFSGVDEKKTFNIANSFRQGVLLKLPKTYEINPVVASGYAKIKDKFRFLFFIRGPNIYTINKAIKEIGQAFRLPSGIRLLIDVNPLSTYF